jgi:adenylate cyclase
VGSLSIKINNIGTAYHKLGQHKTAMDYIDKALAMAIEKNLRNEMRNAWEMKAIVEESIGNPEKALQAYKNFKALNDSLMGEESVRTITQLSMQYEFNQKQKILDLEQEKVNIEQRSKYRRQQLYTAIAILAFIFVLGFAFIIFRNNRLKQKTNIMLRMQKKQLESEKQKSENLLLNILPFDVAEELKIKGKASVKNYQNCSVMFADFQNFTGLCEQLGQQAIISQLDAFFIKFDTILRNIILKRLKQLAMHICVQVVCRGKTNGMHTI